MLTIKPSILEGIVTIPSSKSMGHRMMICAALSKGESCIANVNLSKDLIATKRALEALGAIFTFDGQTWHVKGIGSQNPITSTINIDCEESGSTLRFMIPIASGLANHAVFTGKNKLIERPINEYFNLLRQSDVVVDYEGRLPLSLSGRFKGGNVSLENTKSSQYISGLLMAAPILEQGIQLQVSGTIESKAYIDLSIEAMKQFGVEVRASFNELTKITYYEVNRQEVYTACSAYVEGDYSQAAFWIVAGLLGKRPLKLSGLKRDSLQGDAQIIGIAQSMGGNLNWEEDLLVVYPSETKARTIDVSQIPDLVPALGILAARSEGTTEFINGERLRIKESDRIKATVDILNRLGVTATELENGFAVSGKRRHRFVANEALESWNDHRIAMAASIAGIYSEVGIGLMGGEAVTKSYPHFFETLVSLGGHLNGQYIWK